MSRKINFYHSDAEAEISFTISLIDKIYKSGKRNIVICHDEAYEGVLDGKLWSFSQLNFLPHLTEKDLEQHNVNPADQQILLTTNHVNINGAEIATICHNTAVNILQILVQILPKMNEVQTFLAVIQPSESIKNSAELAKKFIQEKGLSGSYFVHNGTQWSDLWS